MYNEKFMEEAYLESLNASDKGEVPIGAVIVKNGKIIGKGHNLKESNKCSYCHAEILAIQEASKYLQNWRLNDCDIYVTLEPCPMCASAIHQARLSNIYYCVKSTDENNFEIISKILADNTSNSPVDIYFVEYKEKVKRDLQEFFKKRR